MSEVVQCPFCDAIPDTIIREIPMMSTETLALCRTCGIKLPIAVWNTRPAERRLFSKVKDLSNSLKELLVKSPESTRPPWDPPRNRDIIG